MPFIQPLELVRFEGEERRFEPGEQGGTDNQEANEDNENRENRRHGHAPGPQPPSRRPSSTITRGRLPISFRNMKLKLR